MKKLYLLLAVGCWLLAASADSLDCRFVGNWPFGTSHAIAFDSARNLVFVGSGGGVYVFDATDTLSPRKVSERIHTLGYVWCLAYDPLTERLYIADYGEGLDIWDVSIPTMPTHLGGCATPGLARGVAVTHQAGHAYALVADGDSGLRVIDATDPFSPVEIGHLNTPAIANGVAISGGTAYVAAATAGLLIVDISDPSHPQQLGRCGTPDLANGVSVADTVAYVADYCRGLSVINVANPAQPRQIAQDTLRGRNYAAVLSVAAVGHYVYLGDLFRLLVFDVSNPSWPLMVGSVGAAEFNYQIAVSGKYAYSMGSWDQDGLDRVFSTFEIVNITNPSSPRVVASLNLVSRTFGVAVAGRFAYVANEQGGLRIIDISDLSNPHETGYYTPWSEWHLANNVAVSGQYAYVADDQQTLTVVDVSDSSNPQAVGHWHCPDWGFAHDIVFRDSEVFIANDYSGLRIVCVSNPLEPREIGVCSTMSYARGIALSGRYAYVAERYLTGVFEVFDISDPSHPRRLGSYQSQYAFMDVAVSDDYAYVAAAGGGLLVLDVSDPNSPRLVARDTIGMAYGVAVAGGFVYVADYGYGLRVVDVSDPSNPIWVGYHHATCWPMNVCVVGQYAFLADVDAGLQVYQFLGTGMEEGSTPQASCTTPNASIVRGVLFLPHDGTRSEFAEPNSVMSLLDISGRKVLDLHAGANDVSRVAPGVYFIRSERSAASRAPSAVAKVVIQK
jgi:hypothetical protein